MWYADTVGVEKGVAELRWRILAQAGGMLQEPAPLLKKLAESGGKLAEFEPARPWARRLA